MFEPLFNFIVFTVLAKFVLNDIPHAMFDNESEVPHEASLPVKWEAMPEVTRRILEERGVPVGPSMPESVAKLIYPSVTSELLLSPESEAGFQIRDFVFKNLREFMAGGNFILLEKFSEAQWDVTSVGWEYIAYEGELVHALTGTLLRARVQVELSGTEVIRPTSSNISMWVLPDEEDFGSWRLNREGGREAAQECYRRNR